MGILKELDALHEQASENIVDAADLYDSLGDEQTRSEFIVKVDKILTKLIGDVSSIIRSRK